MKKTKLLIQKYLGGALLIIAILTITVVPFPSEVLDILFIISMVGTIIISLISLNILKPTNLTTFPTLFVILTLFRVSLYIASTRMILSHVYEDNENVSSIVASFGDFVFGGSFVIGIFLFAVFVSINFLIIKGYTGIAEIHARLAFDYMPGKLMAIDADLSAGFIDDAEAKQHRADIMKYSTTNVALETSSSFLKADFAASIVIIIIGGFLISLFQHDMSINESSVTYIILATGAGLIFQLQILIISFSIGIMFDRSSRNG